MTRSGWILLFLTSCAISLFPSPALAGQEKKNWSEAGTRFQNETSDRTGFFIAGDLHGGAVVTEVRRAAGGAGLRAGYGLLDSLSVYLQNEWTLTGQFQVWLQLLDFHPHVAWFLTDTLYLMGGGGLTLGNSSSGTTLEGFSRQKGVWRKGFGAGGGIGAIALEGSGLSLAFELETVYRRIGSGNYLQPEIRGLLFYRF